MKFRKAQDCNRRRRLAGNPVTNRFGNVAFHCLSVEAILVTAAVTISERAINVEKRYGRVPFVNPFGKFNQNTLKSDESKQQKVRERR